MWRWDLFAGSLRAQFVAAGSPRPLMLERERGLIVNVSFTDRGISLGNARTT